MCCYIEIELEILQKLIKEMHDQTQLSDRQLLANETLNAEIRPVKTESPSETSDASVLLLSVKSPELVYKLETERFGAVLEATAIELFPNIQGVEVYLSRPVAFTAETVQSVH